MFAVKVCSLNPAGRKTLITAFEQRLEHVTTHPFFGYRVSMRRLIDVQCRLLFRFFQGEIAEYFHYLPRLARMAKERLYVVTYDISDSKPWRKAFRLLKGFGH